MIYVIFIVICLYLFVFLFLFFQLLGNKQNVIDNSDKESIISVLVPVRNEQHRISCLMEQFKKINYCCFEVVIVDDHSDDSTIKQLRNINLTFVSFVQLPDNLQGKKNAIKYGLTYCKGDWVIFTDADVEFSSNWIKTLSSHFIEADFILAPVLIKKLSSNSLLYYFETIDMLAMQAFTYIATNAKYPFLASAANMAVRKEVAMKLYQQMDTSIPSGDDVFLLHEYLKKSNRVYYVIDNDAKVFVPPSTSWLSFFKQRIRWVSKAKYYQNKNALFFSWLIFLAHILSIFAFIQVLFFKGNYYLFLSLMIIKFLIDMAFMAKSLQIFKQSLKLMLVFPLAWFFYFFYISFVPIISLFFKVEWKNRRSN